MKFEKAMLEIEYLKNLDVILMDSTGTDSIDSSITTSYSEGDFGLGGGN